jgi:imidazolonepropionase-like amidohydrolase
LADFVIRNVQIFDGTGAPSQPGAVAITGDRITSVAWGDDALVDKTATTLVGGCGETATTVIDGRGMTLMPGMVEAHGHLTWGSSIEKIYHAFMLPPEELKVAAWRNARVLLESGFTSLYSAGALGDGIETALVAAIDAGETPGPRMWPSTLERSPEGDDTGDIFNGRGATAMRGFVDHCRDTGVKIVKLVISGEDALKPGSSHEVNYTQEELAAAQDASAANGQWLSAHVYHPRAIALALDHGVRVLYHCSFADAASMDAMVAHKDSIFYAPGPGVSVAALEANPPPHVDMTHMKASAAERLALEAKLVPELKRRGVRVLPGGDYGFPFNPNGTNALDLQHFVTHYGFTPAEALVSATKLGGELMDLPLGQVREGWLADLLLVDGDPTTDVSIMADRSRLAMIMKGGVVYKAPASLAPA